MAQTGRPPRSRNRTLETIRDLAARGETDAANGGVATSTVADELDLPQKVIGDHAHALVNDGKLERVRGLGPNGPRPSYLPTEEP